MTKLLLPILVLFNTYSIGQDAISYQQPHPAIYDLVMAAPTPSVSISNDGKWLLIMNRSEMPTVEDLAQPELRIAGLRINPNNFGPSRATYFTGFVLKNLTNGKEYSITGLPLNMKAGGVSWNHDDSKFAFTNNSNNSIDLYQVDVNTRKVVKLNKQPLNVLQGIDYTWIDNQTILYNSIVKPASMAPAHNLAPTGPVVQQSLGKTAASVTYQDLIKSPHDEALFEFYGTSQLIKNTNGVEKKLGNPHIYSNYSVSPDKKYILVQRIDKPYSYLVTARGFNSTIVVTDMDGKLVKEITKLPSAELAPRGNDNVLNAPRSHRWLNNRPATISWIVPLDSGLIKNKMDFHDEALILPAPFISTPTSLVKTPWRMGSVSDVNENLILVTESSRSSHRTRTSKLENGQLVTLIDRSTDDAYNDPGSMISDRNKFGKNTVKLINGSQVLMRSTGASPKGDLPFLASFDINTKKHEIIWRSSEKDYESVISVLDFNKPLIITSKQSSTEQPNYFLRDLKAGTTIKITDFPDQQPSLRGVTREKITYKRKDGVDLAADLYLPKGYDKNKDGVLPVLMWAYPREFKNASDAAQIRGSSNTFTRVNYGSPIFWVNRGFAVMDNTEFPIVGEGETQPNDNFIDQLVWNAEAAIDKIASMGIGDPKRIAVGGHSYGAFMTANLLAHSHLFKAGIARSGAYNRTLTPFGFQNEERTYWQAPDVYNKMSPFSHADKIKTPLLLIHGEADNNPGTFPIQSERLFNAVKGHGGTVRFVQLPYESHGYAAKENILHMLWEMDSWLEKYVKSTK